MSLIRRVFIFQFFIALFFVCNPSLSFGKVIEVPFKSQVPPGVWDNTLNCGQTSYLMVDGFFHNYIPTEGHIKEVDDWIEEVIGDNKRNYSGNYTSVDKLKRLALEYGTYKESEVTIYRGGDTEYLKLEIEKGKPVIIAVYTNMLEKGEARDSKHFMVLTGIEGNTVYVNDPGKTKGKDNMYTIEQFILAWSKNNYASIIFDVENKNVIPEPPIIQPQPEHSPPPSLAKKISTFFSNLFSSDNEDAQSEGSGQVLGEQVGSMEAEVDDEVDDVVEEEPVYTGIFTPWSVVVPITEGQGEATVTMLVKNTGNVAWQAGMVSVNVVGGWKQNKAWYHNDWKTKLRPVVISKNVDPGKSETVSFSVSLTGHVSLPLKLQLVRQVGIQFLQMGTSFANVSFQYIVEEPPHEEDSTPDSTLLDIPKKVIKTIKDITEVLGEKIVDTTKDVVNTIPNMFYGGGGGSSGSSGSPVVLPIVIPAIALDTDIPDGTFFTTSSLFLSGTKNDVTTNILFSSPSTTVLFPSSTAWEADVLLSEGENDLILTPVDASGESGESLFVNVVLDSIPPESISLTAERTSASSTDIALSWSAEDEASGVVLYDIDVQIDGGEWKTLFSGTSVTGSIFIGIQPYIYTFRARAVDVAGNISDWKENIVSLDWEKSIVINEIAWGGTGELFTASKDCRKHEWIELKNTTAEPIDITGWRVVFTSPSSATSSIDLSGSIASGSYFILARKDRAFNAIAGMPIDLLYTENDLDNSGMSLTLTDAEGSIIDEVLFHNGWHTGMPGRSMERIADTGAGSSVTNWHTAEHISARGGTSGCGLLYGSPAQPNGRLWLLRDVFTQYADMVDDTGTLTLTPEHSPYVLNNETVIPVGNTLVVEPGVELVGISPLATLVVKGTTRFLGTDVSHVRITSARESSDGTWQMDALGNGEPSPGDWSHIHVFPGGTLDMQYTDIVYGGEPFLSSGGFVFGAVPQAQVIRTEGYTSFSHSYILHSYIHPNPKYATYNATVWMTGGTLSISDSVFDTGNIAIKNQPHTTGTARVERTTFSHFSSPEGTIVLDDIWPTSIENEFSDTAGPDIVVPTYTFQTDTTMPAGSTIIGNIFTVPEGVTLDMGAGSRIGLKEGGLFDVYGTLRTHGTIASPVFISSGGGQWGRLTFFSGATGELEYTRITGGGRTVNKESVMLDVSGADVVFNHTDIMYGRWPGTLIRLRGSQTLFIKSHIGYDAIPPNTPASWRTNGIDVRGGETVLDDVQISYVSAGITGDSNTIVSAHNMDSSNFVGVQYNAWHPLSMLQFLLEPELVSIPVGETIKEIPLPASTSFPDTTDVEQTQIPEQTEEKSDMVTIIEDIQEHAEPTTDVESVPSILPIAESDDIPL